MIGQPQLLTTLIRHKPKVCPFLDLRHQTNSVLAFRRVRRAPDDHVLLDLGTKPTCRDILPIAERDLGSPFHMPQRGGLPLSDTVYRLGLGPFRSTSTMGTIQHCKVRRKSWDS